MVNFPNKKIDLQKIAKENYQLNIKKIEVSTSNLKEVLDENYGAILIIVAHGTPEGLQDSSKKTMEWDSVNELIKNENSKLTFMTSCYGKNALNGLDNAYGFSA